MFSFPSCSLFELNIYVRRDFWIGMKKFMSEIKYIIARFLCLTAPSPSFVCSNKIRWKQSLMPKSDKLQYSVLLLTCFTQRDRIRDFFLHLLQPICKLLKKN